MPLAEAAPGLGEKGCGFLVAEFEGTLIAGDPAFRGGGGGGGGGGVGRVLSDVLGTGGGVLYVD